MSERRDVVVVGAGVMGLASAWALKRAGRDVTVLEQFEVGHPYGSSHGASRIFRFAYSETEWVALAQEALPLWRELEHESGTEVLSLTGLLDSSGDSAALRSALDACSAEYEVLDEGEAGRRFGIELEGEVVLELHGGIVRADRALAAFSREHLGRDRRPRARASGRRGRRVAGDVERDDRGRARRRRRRRLGHAACWPTPGSSWRRTSRRRRSRTSTSRRRTRCRRSSTGTEETGRHAYSLSAGENVLKVGLHHSGVAVEPGERGEPDPEVVEAASEWVRQRYPAADPRPEAPRRASTRTSTEDAFVIERHGPIIVCSACSGHGFKFAPAVGTRVAALA